MSSPRSRAKKWLKELRSNVLRAELMACQPSIKIGNHADLHFSCLPCVALAKHLGRVGIKIRTQRPMQFAKLMLSENLLHRCSPSRQAFQKTPPDYAGKTLAKLPANAAEHAL